MTKSDQIRQLTDQGQTVAQIAKKLNSNYSFVYGVVSRYKQFGPPKDRKANSKSERVRQMYHDGKKIPEIRKELGLDYAFVYGVIQRMKGAEALEQAANESTRV
jgi:transposase